MNRRRDSDLNPTITDRIRRLTAPGWMRSVLVRRSVAVALVVCAAVLAVVEHRDPPTPTALVAVRDLRPGQALTAEDVRIASVPEELTPDDAPTVDEVVGRQVTGPVHRGEIIARHRLLDARLPAALTGRSDARLVPVRPADDSLASFVRAGDRVDLLGDDSQVLARDAIVATTPSTDRSGPGETGTLLVAMPADAAHRVAAAGIRDPITFVLH
ncbi:SAF domain-containing protein [Gordonia humi]|uniref:Flp pilus assembly protein CpaB n=1 Tax=Gordonia humi TaxID=686429 RepID=A0A840F805_9ACTN|nr:SAF domain-containing protein [Gordonia humi]MBB4137709.1 Flp pilus assembly protein CpaB [Gordonia humi]